MANTKRNGKTADSTPAPSASADDSQPNLFVSWSGDRSKGPAEAFRAWLKANIPAVRPWISSQDIAKLGSGWREDLMGALRVCRVCVIFLTSDNRTAPWIFFEAGAILNPLRTPD
jgi:hypothetical protein